MLREEPLIRRPRSPSESTTTSPASAPTQVEVRAGADGAGLRRCCAAPAVHVMSPERRGAASSAASSTTSRAGGSPGAAPRADDAARRPAALLHRLLRRPAHAEATGYVPFSKRPRYAEPMAQVDRRAGRATSARPRGRRRADQRRRRHRRQRRGRRDSRLAAGGAGRDVLMIERGDHFDPSEFTEDEVQSARPLYDDGAPAAPRDFRFQVLQGCASGGARWSTTRSASTCRGPFSRAGTTPPGRRRARSHSAAELVCVGANAPEHQPQTARAPESGSKVFRGRDPCARPRPSARTTPASSTRTSRTASAAATATSDAPTAGSSPCSIRSFRGRSATSAGGRRALHHRGLRGERDPFRRRGHRPPRLPVPGRPPARRPGARPSSSAPARSPPACSCSAVGHRRRPGGKAPGLQHGLADHRGLRRSSTPTTVCRSRTTSGCRRTRGFVARDLVQPVGRAGADDARLVRGPRSKHAAIRPDDLRGDPGRNGEQRRGAPGRAHRHARSDYEPTARTSGSCSTA